MPFSPTSMRADFSGSRPVDRFSFSHERWNNWRPGSHQAPRHEPLSASPDQKTERNEGIEHSVRQFLHDKVSLQDWDAMQKTCSRQDREIENLAQKLQALQQQIDKRSAAMEKNIKDHEGHLTRQAEKNTESLANIQDRLAGDFEKHLADARREFEYGHELMRENFERRIADAAREIREQSMRDADHAVSQLKAHVGDMVKKISALQVKQEQSDKVAKASHQAQRELAGVKDDAHGFARRLNDFELRIVELERSVREQQAPEALVASVPTHEVRIANLDRQSQLLQTEVQRLSLAAERAAQDIEASSRHFDGEVDKLDKAWKEFTRADQSNKQDYRAAVANAKRAMDSIREFERRFDSRDHRCCEQLGARVDALEHSAEENSMAMRKLADASRDQDAKVDEDVRALASFRQEMLRRLDELERSIDGLDSKATQASLRNDTLSVRLDEQASAANEQRRAASLASDALVSRIADVEKQATEKHPHELQQLQRTVADIQSQLADAKRRLDHNGTQVSELASAAEQRRERLEQKCEAVNQSVQALGLRCDVLQGDLQDARNQFDARIGKSDRLRDSLEAMLAKRQSDAHEFNRSLFAIEERCAALELRADNFDQQRRTLDSRAAELEQERHQLLQTAATLSSRVDSMVLQVESCKNFEGSAKQAADNAAASATMVATAAADLRHDFRIWTEEHRDQLRQMLRREGAGETIARIEVLENQHRELTRVSKLLGDHNEKFKRELNELVREVELQARRIGDCRSEVAAFQHGIEAKVEATRHDDFRHWEQALEGARNDLRRELAQLGTTLAQGKEFSNASMAQMRDHLTGRTSQVEQDVQSTWTRLEEVRQKVDRCVQDISQIRGAAAASGRLGVG
eukprot:CAMPEP_0170207992 /NCGR_PEP_ID=MMETSP0116_2-20130129/3576_1 /TAXON_ID=400756 /ORGANISM="Durinskia baltica, Strain CSIRO CS-38" /LENGTH=867 /DNA_ID=CAMNT_0010458455 /DNA_START=68 /DNA_END=2667 /DNA_ORIENTATION=-